MLATQVPPTVTIRPYHRAPLIVILESRCGIGYKFHIGYNVLGKRRSLLKLALSAMIALGVPSLLYSQDLSPRAYVTTPLHANAITLTYGFYDSALLFGPA